MKLWRKMAMKEGKGTGRQIKYMHQMQEAAFKNQPRIYPLLARVLIHSGIATVGNTDGTPLANRNVETVNEAV